MFRKFIKVVGVLALVFAAVGVYGYVRFLMPDPKMQAQLKNEFGVEYFEPSGSEVQVAAEDTEKSIIVQVIDKVVRKFTVKGEVSVNQAETAPPVNDSSTQIAAANPTVKMTEADIIQKYQPQFQSLQSQSAGRMEALYFAGISEWRQRKRDGTLNRSELARKYIQAGIMVERNVDGQFYSMLNEMQAELVANNLSTAVIADVTNKYISAKNSKKRELLSRVGL